MRQAAKLGFGNRFTRSSDGKGTSRVGETNQDHLPMWNMHRKKKRGNNCIKKKRGNNCINNNKRKPPLKMSLPTKMLNYMKKQNAKTEGQNVNSL